MEFRTELTITPKPLIDHRSTIVTAGSCFSENIGQKLSENKFRTSVNPLGVCYNPVSIHKGQMMAMPEEDLYVESQGTWKHFDFHSKFSASSKEGLRNVLVSRLVRETADIIMITYGTAWAYRHKSTNKIVANCHKRPQAEFEKILLTIDDVVSSFAGFRKFTDKKIIVTLSPVRHLKDTLELNSVSKSVLRAAIHEIQNSFEGVDYFPAYEIMVDDLRDYRFYEPDMIHPSEMAIDYIWEKFGERYFSAATKELNVRWGKVARSLNHKVFNEGTEQHRKFLEGILRELYELEGLLDVGASIAEIEGQLHK